MLNVGDGRGKERSEKAAQNRADIIDFFNNNPGATATECADSLEISSATVRRHVKAINSERK